MTLGLVHHVSGNSFRNNKSFREQKNHRTKPCKKIKERKGSIESTLLVVVVSGSLTFFNLKKFLKM